MGTLKCTATLYYKYSKTKIQKCNKTKIQWYKYYRKWGLWNSGQLTCPNVFAKVLWTDQFFIKKIFVDGIICWFWNILGKVRNYYFKGILRSIFVSLKYPTQVLLLSLQFLSQIDVFLLWIWPYPGSYLIFSSCLGQLKELGCEILAPIFFWG